MSEQVKTKRWGARSIASLLIFILATVLTIPALIGHWGHRTVIDSERYIQTVGPLIEQPEVQAALATAVTDAVVAKVDTTSQVEGLLGNLFPDAGFTDQLAAPIAAGINSLIGELVTKFVASDQFATVWIQLNTAAQKGVVLVLEGKDGGIVRLDGDNLVLDTSVALQAIQQKLVDSGITAAANVTIPESDSQIVLANTPGLAQVQTIYSLTAPILQWLPLIVAIMFGLAIGFARRRARTTVATGIVLLVSGVVILLGLGIGETAFVNELAGTPWGPAAGVFWSTLLDYLVAGTQAIVTLGIVVIIAGWFGGRTRLARSARGQVNTGLGQLSGRMFSGRPGPIPADKVGYVRWIIYIVGVAIVLGSDLMSVSSVLWITALVAGAVTLAQLLAGAGGEVIEVIEVEVEVDGGSGNASLTETPSSGVTTTL
jgi:hypothetical protein